MSTPPQAFFPTLPERRLRLPRGLTWTTLGLIGIVVLAATLRFANIGEIGQANTYYTAATESMLQSWHNFFFVAAEPGGSVSIDKPPVGLWIQAASAYFLGVNGFAVVLPQILAGILAVVLLFHLVRRSFGAGAGLLAAFALAVTPVAIAVERNNTPDSTLILTLLLAAWAFIKATETRRLGFLLLGAVLVGIGFNIKMMQAFLPLPAFYALYFLGSQQGWWRKIWHLGLATLVLLVVSLSWAVVVDLTPADQRPYVGSSENNSVLNLMLGYNGIQRLSGNTESMRTARYAAVMEVLGADQNASGPPPAEGLPGEPGGEGGAFDTGDPSILRMFQAGLAAQVSWLLPFGLLLLLAMGLSVAWWRPHTALHHGLIVWGVWLITCIGFFSVASFFHQYYLAMLGAPLAAIVGIGLTFVWRLRANHPRRAALLLLVTALATLAFQVYAVGLYGALTWWIALPLGLGAAGLSLLPISLWRNRPSLARLSFALVIAALLVVPAVWSGLTTAYANTGGPMPQAYAGASGGPGPGGLNRPGTGRPAGGANTFVPAGGGAGGGQNQAVDPTLLAFLQAHSQDTKYLLVVPSSMAGAGYVLATGRPVLYAGGFNGGDQVIDAVDLATLVANREVRYVLWGDGGPGRNSNAGITSYLTTSCSVVSVAGSGAGAPQPASAGPAGFGRGRGQQSTLYQCSP